jgi:hypothetical protein
MRCTISPALRSHYPYTDEDYVPISPELRATFCTRLSDALTQAAKETENVVPGGPDMDGSLQEMTQVFFYRAARILDGIVQVLKLDQKENRWTMEMKGQRDIEIT